MITLCVALPNGGVVSYFSPEQDRTIAVAGALDVLKKIDVEGSAWTVNEIGADGKTLDLTEQARAQYGD